jgi:hypothetical protein
VKWKIDLLHGTAPFGSRKGGSATGAVITDVGRALMRKVSSPIFGALLNYLTTCSGTNREVQFCKSIRCQNAQQLSRGRIAVTARHARNSNTGEMRKKYFVTAARAQSSTYRWNRSGNRIVLLGPVVTSFPRSGAPAMQRHRPNHERLIEEARRLREEAAKVPDGMARHLLLQEAFRAETAVNVDRWLSSPG